MFTIALCDDDPTALAQTLEMVQHWKDANPQAAALVESCDKMDHLQDMAVHGTVFDVYLLDILTPGMSGIELGQFLRQNTAEAPCIIYATSSKDFALEAFANRALHYLLKPIQEPELFEALDRALRLTELHQQEVVPLNTPDGIVVVNPNQIVYIENVRRSPQYHLADGETIKGTVNRGTLESAIGPLRSHPDFICPHQSFWVNMRFVRRLHTEELLMDDGLTIPVSRTRAPEVKRLYLKFLTRTENQAVAHV